MSASLNREEKLLRIKALQEKKRRLIKAKPQYRPTPGQLAVLKSKAKNRFNFSGNGGGKTTLLVQDLWATAHGTNPWTGETTKVPAKLILVCDNTKKIEERLIPEMRKWFDMDSVRLLRQGKPYTSRIEFSNGSTLDFYSVEADPSSFEGVEASGVYVDEPVPRPLYIALKRSLRLKGYPNKFLFAGTAISEAWLRREIFEPWAKGDLPDTECFRLASDDNKENLAEGYLEEFGRALSEAEKEVRLKGGFFDTDSLALAHLWDRKVHIVDAKAFKYKEDMPCVIALDPHAVKPHTAVMICAPPQGGIIAIKEMALRSNASGFAKALYEFKEGYNVIDIVCDSLGSTEGTAFEGMASFIEVLQKHGLRVRATQFQEKSAEDLVERLQNGLHIPEQPDQFGQRTPRLRVLSTLTGLIADIEYATWQKNRITGEVIPKIDTSIRDRLSCLGYALAANLFYDRLARSRPSYADLPSQVAGNSQQRAERRAEKVSQRRARMGMKLALRRARGN